MKARAATCCTIQLGSISSLRCQKSRTSPSIQTGACEVMFSRTMMVRLRRRPVFALRASTRQPSLGSACRSAAGAASEGWWSQTGSNRRPHACKARALPAELWPRNQKTNASGGKRSMKMVGLGRLELPTSRLSSARSNQLSYKPSAREASTHAGMTGHMRCAAPGACSSAKKEKRRRRNPANGAQRSGDLLAPDVSKTVR